jgi:predicted  nucleic acid-binding Zn-ribbon protein
MEKLDKIKDDLIQNIEKEKQEVNKFSAQNEELGQKLEQIYNIKENYKSENQHLQSLIENGQAQIEDLEELKDRYTEQIMALKGELDKSKDNNEELKTQINTLDNQLEKLKKLYADTKQLMFNLSQGGDIFNQFSTSIDTSVVKLDDTQDDLDQTAKQLEALVEKLKSQKFEELDINQDGNISKDEFEKNLNSE